MNINNTNSNTRSNHHYISAANAEGRPSNIMSNDALNTLSRSDIMSLDDSSPSNNNKLHRNSSTNSSFKQQKKGYEDRKKFYTKNIQSAIDSTQEVHSGWLKARTTFKRWTKVWCQIKPGYLIIYTTQEAQKKHRLGVVMVSICQAIIRPTKKDGFCFKLINPFGCSVWAKSSTRALAFSAASLTLRAIDEPIGKLWLDALHRCNLSANLDGYQPVIEKTLGLNDTMSSQRSCSSMSDISETISGHHLRLNNNGTHSNNNSTPSICNNSMPNKTNDALNAPSAGSGKPIEVTQPTASSSSKLVSRFSKYNWKELKLEKIKYLCDNSEELGSAGVQSEDVHESNKNFLWHIIKQLRPGMDLSKVTLPTFILEPRSFLEKLADYYYHCDILSVAVQVDDPVMRLVNIVKWYLSGFYKKPKGPKKPYNPILGERFRCFWDHPKTQSRTFFVAEQVSHHPPISAFHVSNRKDGYTITCALLSRSKFSGNSVQAILEGEARLYLNKRNELYTLTMPHANCRGILLGSLCMELGGKVEIKCADTGCRCELDFKLAAPVWANSNSYNSLTGKIFKDNKLTHTLEGHWDKKITLHDKRSDEKSVLWEINDKIRNSRLQRYTVATEDQNDRESVKLWSKVTAALVANDQQTATVEKTKLEDMQRQEARDRKGPFAPQSFKPVSNTSDWTYKWQDNRPWNERSDIMQFEDDFKVRTLMNMTSTASGSPSIPNFNPNIDLPLGQLSRLTSDAVDSANPTSNSSSQNGPSSGAKHRDTFSSIESKIDAENLLIRREIRDVLDRNMKLEQDLASLKRGRKTAAIVAAAILVAILSLFFRYFS